MALSWDTGQRGHACCQVLGYQGSKVTKWASRASEGEQTKVIISKGLSGGARAEAVSHVCSVALVEQPDPDVSLPPCAGWGMWDKWLGVDKPFAHELSLPLVLHHTREIPLFLLSKPPWSTHRKMMSHMPQWMGQRFCSGPLLSTGHYKRHKPWPWAAPLLHCMSLCLKSHTGPLFFYSVRLRAGSALSWATRQWWPCSAHSRNAIASIGGDAVRPTGVGALLGRNWQHMGPWIHRKSMKKQWIQGPFF